MDKKQKIEVILDDFRQTELRRLENEDSFKRVHNVYVNTMFFRDRLETFSENNLDLIISKL